MVELRRTLPSSLRVNRRLFGFRLFDQLGQPFGQFSIGHLFDELAIASDPLIYILANGAQLRPPWLSRSFAELLEDSYAPKLTRTLRGAN